MQKTTRNILICVCVYIVLLIILGIMIINFKWSWSVMIYAIIIPVVLAGIGFLIYKLRANKQKEEVDEEPNVSINEMRDFIKDYVLNDEELADMIEGRIQIELYTPKQEGEIRTSVYKCKMECYYNKDILYIATNTKRKEVLMYNFYSCPAEEAEEDFKKRIDASIVNPEKYVVETVTNKDPYTDSERTISRRTPASYLKKQEEAKKDKELEKEQGGEDE